VTGDRPERGFFRGAELTRFALLAGVMLAGWAWFLTRPVPPPAGIPAPGTTTAGALKAAPPLNPDTGPEFADLRDDTRLSFRDNAAYIALLERSRSKTPAKLAAEARSNVLFTHLRDNPKGYRGVPVHIVGTALRILSYEVDEAISPTKRMYEAWVVTPDSQKYPYLCVFDEAPPGLPIGPNVHERIAFNGYFLKWMAYLGGDKGRIAPMLVGRIGWDATTAATADAPPISATRTPWFALGIGLLLLYGVSRWFGQMKRLSNLLPSARRRRRSQDRPREYSPEPPLPPEQIGQWLANLEAGTPPPDDEPR
jgi:hypothetical protein